MAPLCSGPCPSSKPPLSTLAPHLAQKAPNLILQVIIPSPGGVAMGPFRPGEQVGVAELHRTGSPGRREGTVVACVSLPPSLRTLLPRTLLHVRKTWGAPGLLLHRARTACTPPRKRLVTDPGGSIFRAEL